jgi:hypothetical protein
MSETETTEAFLKRMREKLLFDGRDDDEERLLSLADRGAAIPDEPDEMVIYAMREAWKTTRRGGAGGMTIDNQYRMEFGPELAAYRAMLSIALKESSQPSEVNIHEWTERRRY